MQTCFTRRSYEVALLLSVSQVTKVQGLQRPQLLSCRLFT